MALVSMVAALAAAPVQVSHTVDTRLCGFPLEVTLARRAPADGITTNVLRFAFAGPATITLRNAASGRTVALRSPGTHSVDTRDGSLAFSGHQVWLWSTGKHVPFLATDGSGTLKAPSFVLEGGARPDVLDPCALVGAPAPAPRATTAPWGSPTHTLSRIAGAGLVPLLGAIVRHDHVHLDVIVDGHRVTVPAGIGLAEPVDTGPCPALAGKNGDCATGHGFFGEVANSPLHTHSSSGLIHIEADRPGRYTLGQFFDEWGVRLGARCVGAYCTGGGKELRVYVDGRRVSGSPRAIALTDHQEIAVVFGGPGAFRSVPATYGGGWPGAGCGGAGERSCLS
jgi:hypothetical protein